jgi:hypothetical protein
MENTREFQISDLRFESGVAAAALQNASEL